MSLLLALLWLPPSLAAPAVQAPIEVPAFTGVSDTFSLREAVAEAGLSWPPPRPWLEIDKSERRMTAWSGELPLKHYRVGLADAEGDKLRQGDLKTPTGTFRVVTRNPKSSFHLFLGLSYPDAGDADRGVASGLINESQASTIRLADQQRRLPPWNTRLGGAVGIHGGGGSADWTLGCIAVEDHEIEEIWDFAPMRTGIVIQE